MKIKFTGNMTVKDVENKLQEVVDSTISKLKEGDTEVAIEGWELDEVEVQVKFKIEGVEEPQVLTIEHHEDQPEMFTWLVDMDKDQSLNNEEESLVDVWSASMAKGEAYDFEEIITEYGDDGLEEIDVEIYSDMSKKVYNIKGTKDQLVRIYQYDKLVQEYRLKDIEEN